MTELLKFIFSSFWTFAGTVILAAVVIVAPVSLICDAVVKCNKRRHKGPMAAKAGTQ